jgi:IclR family KDG regulon transcriptional repressor
LSHVRQQSSARDNEELELGVRCIAAGIYDDTGKLVAGLSLSAPADRLQDSWLGQLSKTALVISASLGYQPETPPANAHPQHA